MKKSLLLEKLSGALGVFGWVLYYIITTLLSFAPLIMLDFSFWINIALVFVVICIPILGELVLFGLFVWAFIVTVGQPIDVWSVVFFVSTAVYVFTTLIPSIISIFKRDN